MVKNIISTIVVGYIGVINVKMEQRKLSPNKNKILLYRILVICLVLLQIYEILKTI